MSNKVTVLAEWKRQARGPREARPAKPTAGKLRWPSFSKNKGALSWIGSIPLDSNRYFVIFRSLDNKMQEVAGVPAPTHETDIRRYCALLALDGWFPHFGDDDGSPQVFDEWNPRYPLTSFMTLLEGHKESAAKISVLMSKFVAVTLPFTRAAVPPPPISIHR